MWSCEFRKVRKEISRHESDELPGIFQTVQNEAYLLDGIRDGSIFGFLIADVSTPEDVQKKWRDFPPVLRKMTVTADHLNENMIKVLKKENPGIELKDFQRETLVQVFNAKDQVILSSLAKFYMEQGLIISNITAFVQYIAYPALLPFAEHVTEMRVTAEKNGETVKGNTAKGN